MLYNLYQQIQVAPFDYFCNYIIIKFFHFMLRSCKKLIGQQAIDNNNKTNVNTGRVNRVELSFQSDIKRYQNQNVKSMSTLPSKNFIQLIGRSAKRDILLDERSLSRKNKTSVEKAINLKESDKILHRSYKYLNSQSSYRSPNIQRRFYESKKEGLGKKSLFIFKSRQLDKKNYKGSNPQRANRQIRQDEHHKIDKTQNVRLYQKTQNSYRDHEKQEKALQQQNFRLRSSLLDYKLRQRDQADEINRLQTLCIKLQKFISKQDRKTKTKEEEQYLRVVKLTFMECFGLDDFKTIWTEQKRILKEWMHYKEFHSSSSQLINRNKQSSRRGVNQIDGQQDENQEIRIKLTTDKIN